jgi:hypothetical protein
MIERQPRKLNLTWIEGAQEVLERRGSGRFRQVEGG